MQRFWFSTCGKFKHSTIQSSIYFPVRTLRIVNAYISYIKLVTRKGLCILEFVYIFLLIFVIHFFTFTNYKTRVCIHHYIAVLFSFYNKYINVKNLPMSQESVILTYKKQWALIFYPYRLVFVF